MTETMPSADEATTPPVPGEGEPSPAPEQKSDAARGKRYRMSELVPMALKRIERAATGLDVAVPLPFRAWADALGGGLHPGAHFVVGAPKAGKSTLLSQIALRAAEDGHDVTLVPLELGAEQTGIRLIADAARIEAARTGGSQASTIVWSELATGRASERATEEARRIAAHLAELPITVVDGAAGLWPAEQLSELARAAAERAEPEDEGGERKTPLVVLDFLQIVGSSDPRADLRIRIREASYAAQEASKAHRVAILIVSSAARNHYPLLGGSPEAWAKKENPAELTANMVSPKGESARFRVEYASALMGLGKESGEIEYAATSITTLVGTHARANDSASLRALVVATQRYGLPAWVPLRFYGGHFDSGTIEDAETITQALKGEKGEASKGTKATSGSPPAPPSEFADDDDDDLNERAEAAF